MKGPRFEAYRSRDGWRWRLRARNGRVIAVGESHTRERDAMRAAVTVATTASDAMVVKA